jgi:2,3-dihydroxybiphenyl 1,2-dioxygenase
MDSPLVQEIEQFLYREARLLDERRHLEWLELFTDDVRYWMPVMSTVERGSRETNPARHRGRLVRRPPRRHAAQGRRRMAHREAQDEPGPDRAQRQEPEHLLLVNNPSAAVTQLGYLGLAASDLAAWETFAREILGLQARNEDGVLYLRMDEHHHRFALEAGSQDDLAYVGWEVAGEQAMDELAARLERAEYAVERCGPAAARARKVEALVRLRDPSGIATEIFYGPLVDVREPFTPTRAISGFEAGRLGLGHIVLAVDDMEESLRFYRELLGMRTSDLIEFTMRTGREAKLAFLHCNPRHHSIAFMAAPLPKRLLHFMVQVRSLDDVGSTQSLCEERGVPLVTTLGRHTNDRMLSFYLQSPSGFEIEYGWGACEVDDATWQVQTHRAASMWGHSRLTPHP